MASSTPTHFDTIFRAFFLFVLISPHVSAFLASDTRNVSVTDPNMYFTEFNWYVEPTGKYAQTVNPGAYFKVAVVNASGIVVNLDLSGAPSKKYCTVRYSLDNQPYTDVQLSSGFTELVVGQNLPQGNHTLVFYLLNSIQVIDRWEKPQNFLRVVSLTLSPSTANTTQLTAPFLRPKRILTYWDSIGEGVNVLGNVDGTDLGDNDATFTWAFSLAAALHAEVSMVGFGRQGYTIDGNGNVPPLFTPDNDTLSAWDKLYANQPRVFSNKQLDYVFCGHGTNDAGAADKDVIQRVFGWLLAVRGAAPSVNIFLCVPFGGFKRGAINSGFNLYQQSKKDSNAYLIDLGAGGQLGVDQWIQGGTFASIDGVHPLAWRDGQLGAMLAISALSAISHTPFP